MGRLTRWVTALAWLVLAASIGATVAFAIGWNHVRRINAAIAGRRVETLKPLPADERVRYAAGWDEESAQRFDQAIALYTDARATDDPALAARAWFALGNAYFETAIRASRAAVVHEGPQAESAEFGLARDAYRSALRIDPQLHGARYNLELLERLAPERPAAGWRRNTDPILMQPDRHSGWTTIQESAKRGLP
jgi:tetratricopeptide (TPR) repeat protein